MKNLNIPSEKLKQQFFVRFCSTSPDASSNEQFQAFLENWYVRLLAATVKRPNVTTVAVRNTYQPMIVNSDKKSCFESSHTIYLPTTHNRQNPHLELAPMGT
jgi:hypothetical protein